MRPFCFQRQKMETTIPLMKMPLRPRTHRASGTTTKMITARGAMIATLARTMMSSTTPMRVAPVLRLPVFLAQPSSLEVMPTHLPVSMARLRNPKAKSTPSRRLGEAGTQARTTIGGRAMPCGLLALAQPWRVIPELIATAHLLALPALSRQLPDSLAMRTHNRSDRQVTLAQLPGSAHAMLTSKTTLQTMSLHSSSDSRRISRVLPMNSLYRASHRSLLFMQPRPRWASDLAMIATTVTETSLSSRRRGRRLPLSLPQSL